MVISFQELFFTFPWNNFLHMQVELCVLAVLESSSLGNKGEEECKEETEDTPKTALLVSAEDLKSLRVHVSYLHGNEEVAYGNVRYSSKIKFVLPLWTHYRVLPCGVHVAICRVEWVLKAAQLAGGR